MSDESVLVILQHSEVETVFEVVTRVLACECTSC